MEKNSNFIKDKDDLIKNMKSGNIEPMPPNNIISIINNDKNNNKYKLSLHCINIAEINNIIINNINQISNYNSHTIINQIDNQTIYNLNFNIYTNNVFSNNKRLIRKHSKPIFAVCSDSDEIHSNKSKIHQMMLIY